VAAGFYDGADEDSRRKSTGSSSLFLLIWTLSGGKGMAAAREESPTLVGNCEGGRSGGGSFQRRRNSNSNRRRRCCSSARRLRKDVAALRLRRPRRNGISRVKQGRLITAKLQTLSFVSLPLRRHLHMDDCTPVLLYSCTAVLHTGQY
jgi:hypothetical protein